MENELWCMQVEGPDDLHAAPSKEAAQQRADQLNAWWAKKKADEPSEFWPLLNAVVAPWPYSAESHAKGLLKWNGK